MAAGATPAPITQRSSLSGLRFQRWERDVRNNERMLSPPFFSFAVSPTSPSTCEKWNRNLNDEVWKMWTDCQVVKKKLCDTVNKNKFISCEPVKYEMLWKVRIHWAQRSLLFDTTVIRTWRRPLGGCMINRRYPPKHSHISFHQVSKQSSCSKAVIIIPAEKHLRQNSSPSESSSTIK